MNDNWVAFVPIRGGSKGLPAKNTRMLAGKPLYQHTIDQALRAGATHCYISTDIPEVLAHDHGPHVTAFLRPNEFAQDGAPMDDVLIHFLTTAHTADSLVVLLQATSPLRTAQDIGKALKVYADNNFDLVMSVTVTDSGFLKYGTSDDNRFVPVSKPEYCFANRQSLPRTYRPNGAVYVFAAAWLRENSKLATDNIGMSIMDVENSHDIDTLSDFEHAEKTLQGKH